MPRVKLSEIQDAMEAQSEETHSFVDKQTGQVVVVSDEDMRLAEEIDQADGADEADDLSDLPDWQRETVEQAKAVLAEEGGRFVSPPDQFEIHEWDMMRDFADGVEDEAVSERLLNAIDGRGAFRYFKDCVHEAGLADQWYKFRDDQYRRIAADWCRENGIEVDEDA